MLCFAVVLSILTTFTMKSASSDSTLRLYDAFAEIHQVYKGPLRFRQTDWDNIKHESIILQSASEVNNVTMFFERRILRIDVNMTGQ